MAVVVISVCPLSSAGAARDVLRSYRSLFLPQLRETWFAWRPHDGPGPCYMPRRLAAHLALIVCVPLLPSRILSGFSARSIVVRGLPALSLARLNSVVSLLNRPCTRPGSLSSPWLDTYPHLTSLVVASGRFLVRSARSGVLLLPSVLVLSLCAISSELIGVFYPLPDPAVLLWLRCITRSHSAGHAVPRLILVGLYHPLLLSLSFDVFISSRVFPELMHKHSALRVD